MKKEISRLIVGCSLMGLVLASHSSFAAEVSFSPKGEGSDYDGGEITYVEIIRDGGKTNLKLSVGKTAKTGESRSCVLMDVPNFPELLQLAKQSGVSVDCDDDAHGEYRGIVSRTLLTDRDYSIHFSLLKQIPNTPIDTSQAKRTVVDSAAAK